MFIYLKPYLLVTKTSFMLDVNSCWLRLCPQPHSRPRFCPYAMNKNNVIFYKIKVVVTSAQTSDFFNTSYLPVKVSSKSV